MSIVPQLPMPTSDPRTLLKSLQNDFPVFRDGKPLAIGIDKQLLARLPELDRKTLRIVLSMHTHSTRYLKAMAKGTRRYDLDGNPAEEIAEAHRKHAAELLRERAKKETERRKAEQALAAEENKRQEAARQLEAAERERSEKLGQLVAKFGRGN